MANRNGTADLTHFTLYSRSYCHLCEEMLAALSALRDEFAFTIDLIDVDADPILVEKYNEWVPVLIGNKKDGEAVQLCHYHLNESKVREFLFDGVSGQR